MKKITVMVFGAFDGLHPGHLNFFSQAKKFGDFLIVSVGTDANVAKIKGKKPLFKQKDRLDLVANCKLVDETVLGAEKDFYQHIAKYKPAVICLGYDQWETVDKAKKELAKVGLADTKVVRLKPYKTYAAKSSIVKRNWSNF